MNFTHQAIWAAIDGIAVRYAHSPSGLAKQAGLNATTFNKSKRFTTSGRERWPSTESIAKVLDATGAGFDEFITLMMEASPAKDVFGQRLTLVDMKGASSHEYLDHAGKVLPGEWDQINFPEMRDDCAFALEVIDDDCMPVYRSGDILVISPGSEVRTGDRVAVKLKNGDLFLSQLLRRTAKRVELAKLQNSQSHQHLELSDVEWISRIVWARQ